MRRLFRILLSLLFLYWAYITVFFPSLFLIKNSSFKLLEKNYLMFVFMSFLVLVIYYLNARIYSLLFIPPHKNKSKIPLSIFMGLILISTLLSYIILATVSPLDFYVRLSLCSGGFIFSLIILIFQLCCQNFETAVVLNRAALKNRDHSNLHNNLLVLRCLIPRPIEIYVVVGGFCLWLVLSMDFF